MIKTIKKILRKILASLSYSIISNKLFDNSDDPILVATKIIDSQKAKIIVDAGASIGDTSKKFSTLFPNAIVHAFEPFPKFFKILEENCKKSIRVVCYQNALSNRTGSMHLNVNKSEGTNSLLQSESSPNHPHHGLLSTESTIEVCTNTLDRLFPNDSIDLLKLDLQGGEYDALVGSRKLLKQGRIKCILCEVMFTTSYEEQANWTELVSYIENSGFQLFNLYQGNHYNGKILQADLLFIHENSMDISMKMAKKHFLPFSNILSNA